MIIESYYKIIKQGKVVLAQASTLEISSKKESKAGIEIAFSIESIHKVIVVVF